METPTDHENKVNEEDENELKQVEKHEWQQKQRKPNHWKDCKHGINLNLIIEKTVHYILFFIFPDEVQLDARSRQSNAASWG